MYKHKYIDLFMITLTMLQLLNLTSGTLVTINFSYNVIQSAVLFSWYFSLTRM